MSRVLLTGSDGQVGWELRRTLAPLGEVVALDRQGMDLANPDSIRRVVRAYEPHLIVNAAAYTAVDKAEEEAALAMAVNATAPGVLAEEARRCGAALIHYSTDYVFDGSKPAPYLETDAPNPLNVYGRSKLAGERAIERSGVAYLILRTSWVYGSRGRNFLLTMMRLAKERDSLQVVSDQVGAPTWSRDIAEATAQILMGASATTAAEGWLKSAPHGIYHLTAGGETTWHGFAEAILHSMHSNTRLTAVTSADYRTAARRPLNSRLSNDKLLQHFDVRLPDWQSALTACLAQMAA